MKSSQPAGALSSTLMKKHWSNLALLVLLFFTACSPKFGNPEEDTRPPECAALDLTPEECANLGTHTYDYETELPCTSDTEFEVEKFVVTFSESAMELERIEPGTWSHQYRKVSTNTYVWEYAGVEGIPAHVTVEFTTNGFTMAGTENPECGKYVRTLLP